MKFLELKLWKCQNASSSPSGTGVTPGVTCKDPKVIDEYFRKESFNFAFINTMFVSDDFEKPTLPFIDD